jgi:hypothetical protein
VNQRRVLSKGMLGYIGANTEQFDGFEDCCDVVARARDRSVWTLDYVRRLRAETLRVFPMRLFSTEAPGVSFKADFSISTVIHPIMNRDVPSLLGVDMLKLPRTYIALALVAAASTDFNANHSGVP